MAPRILKGAEDARPEPDAPQPSTIMRLDLDAVDALDVRAREQRVRGEAGAESDIGDPARVWDGARREWRRPAPS